MLRMRWLRAVSGLRFAGQIVKHFRTSRGRQCGISLPELLIVGACLLLITSLIGRLGLTSVKNYQHSANGMQAMRTASLGLESMSRELRYCDEILWPKLNPEIWYDGYLVKANNNDGLRFIFRKLGEDSARSSIVGFHWDSKTRILTRCLYKPEFIPNKNNLDEDKFVLNKRVLGREVCNLSINSLNCRLRGGAHFLEVSLTVAYSNQNKTAKRKSSDSALENVKHLVTEVERICVN